MALATVGVLYAVNPAAHSLYPACWWYATTGLKCPGCGGIRATHQLLHGHLAAAWEFNPLAVLLLPLYAWFGCDLLLRMLGRRPLPFALKRPALLWLAFAVLVVFAIVRNIPLR